MKLTGQELIENEQKKKERARINTKNYRDRMKEENPDEYKQNKTLQMQKYRLNVKKRLIEAYANTGDPQKIKEIEPRIEKIDNDIEEIEEEIRRPSQRTKGDRKVQESKNISDFTLLKRKEAQLKKTPSPWWSLKLGPLSNLNDFIEAKKESQPKIKSQLELIDRVMRKIFGENRGLKSMPNIDKLIRKLHRGEDLSKFEKKTLIGNQKDNNGLWFVTDQKIEWFAKQIKNRYENYNAFKSSTTPFVNILSKLAFGSNSFKDSKNVDKKFYEPYSYLTKVAIRANTEYTEMRDKNILKESDTGKIFDFSKENMLPRIQKLETVPGTKMNKFYIQALAGVYGLLVPRRVQDFREMVIERIEAEKTLDTDEAKKFNYLLIDNKFNPIKMIFNIYKTRKTFKRQDVGLDTDIQTILKNHITENKLNIRNRNYLFGSSDYSKSNDNLGTNISLIFTSMFGVKITVNNIRQSAVTTFYKKQNTLEEIKNFAQSMQHSVATDMQYNKFKNEDVLEFEKEDKLKQKNSKTGINAINKKKNEI
jgi:hypothetical protein